MIRAVVALVALSAVSGFTLNMGFQFGNFGGKKAPAKSSPKNAPKGKAPLKSAPAKSSAKSSPSKAAASSSSGFAGGLVGVATENPFLALPLEFDPFKLSEGKSEETLAWYRAAELKVRLIVLFTFPVLTSPALARPHLHARCPRSLGAARVPPPRPRLRVDPRLRSRR